ncbi:MAG: Ribosome-releasing factor 2, mitochondrial [Alectoria fallacina]|uniref:Ribosome-releasing factor 2, mitochondrial n=1 Tax=Alectoria fallacina TaxID=1903189 RepID=A0A8H3J0Q9_9LECA|nr:MAG: Ribosome-releasing factor 2, mitochondrial [Alectoria fallacina]
MSQQSYREQGILASLPISMRSKGKTTTTERMLYYSGHTRRIGNVDEGSTVTDFLPAERARGVTIQSAAISFHWPPLSASGLQKKSTNTSNLVPHNINLIDTPGHADFTFEVLRSLRILDGAVCILDGVAGVEAQTEKVWYQAAKYHIPKIIYINKLDRDGAAFGETVKQIAARLHAWPAVCQVPWWEGGRGQFVGLGDAIGLRAFKWTEGGDGKDFQVISVDDLPSSEADFVREIMNARRALVELLSEHDEHMVEKYLEVDEDHLAIPSEDIVASLRQCVLNQSSNIVPVFAGASFQNMGIQPLLDAVVQLLPSPGEAADPEINLGGVEGTLSSLLSGDMNTAGTGPKSKTSKTKFKKQSTAIVQNLESCALAFKVVHDPRRGALVYVRVYSGSIMRQSVLFNTNLQVSERAPQLLKMYASDSVQIDTIPAGQIGVIPGLKHARTGDTLISYTGANPKSGPPAPLNTLQLRPIEVPPAVFFSSVEPHSMSEEKTVKSALDLLIREDPSLQVSVDEESGQTLLSGMGEFHLEIARDRLVNDLKAKAAMGKIEIAYRESILESSSPDIYVFDKEQSGKQGRASCIAHVEALSETTQVPLDDDEYAYSTYEDGNRITIFLKPTTEDASDPEPWNGDLPPHLSIPFLHSALKNGALAALSRGINYAFQLHNTHVILTLDPRKHIFGAETTPAALSSAARLATKAALKSTALGNGSALMELVMNVTVSVDEASLGAVVNDISSSRGGHIMSLDDADVTSGPTVNSTQEPLPRIDLSKVYAPPDPFGSSQTQEQGIAVDGSRQRNITATVPLKEMVGYLKHLRSLTGGRGTFVMSADRFERVVGQREKVLLRELRGY